MKSATKFLCVKLTEVSGRCPVLPEICAKNVPSPLKNADFDQYLVTISAHGVNGIGLLYITVAVLL